MGLHRLARLISAHVPDFELFVIGSRGKLVHIVVVPADVFYHLGVGFPRDQRIDRRRQLIGLSDIPDADLVVIASGQQVALSARVPVQTVAFECVTQQAKVWADFFGVAAAVLEVVKDVDFSRGGLGRNNFMLLRHVPRSVDFALVVNLKFNLNAFILCDV